MLDAIEPVPVASMHPNDLQKLGLEPGDTIRLTSRRGSVECFARADDGLLEGQVFMPFCYHEAAANLLTTDALDPYAKIPEFKFCAIKVGPANTH
jgi:formate dehydrogenase major subunit